MLNEIIKGISMKLNATFGDGYRIYQKDVKQGLNEPCFFIQVLHPELSSLRGRRFLKRNPFNVRYHPKATGDNAELFAVAERMMWALEYITLPNGDLLRGTGMNYEVVDDVLHFFVNYNHTLIKPYEEFTMETLETDVGTRKG